MHVPQHHAVVHAARGQYRGLGSAAESERKDGVGVDATAAEISNEVARRDVPDEYATIGAGRGEKAASVFERQHMDVGLVSGHVTHALSIGAVPQTNRAIRGAGGDIVRVWVELNTLEKKAIN